MKIAIVYHSKFGHTKVVAECIHEGAAGVKGIDAVLVPTTDLPAHGDHEKDAGWKHLHEARAIIFGCPTFMGTVTADFKQFMDHTGGIWHRQGWRDKLAAGFTNSASLSGDKLHCLDALMTFACQHSMVWVSQGIFPSGTGDTRINRIGSWTGMMAQSDGDKGPDLTPPVGDRDTARLFGARVAKAALRWGTGQG
ncbi:MAG: hypothetical protein RL527_877 [Planctomycetota bacterium]|jgi:multimeric flavodoxin WrbA